MSACISRHGEFSEHDLDGEFTCALCGAVDEDAMRAELGRLRAALSARPQAQEVERLRTEVERVALIEAAHDAFVAVQDGYGYGGLRDGLGAAVDAVLAALPTRPVQAQEVERLRREVEHMHSEREWLALTRERDAALARATSWEVEADRLAQVAGDEHRRAEAAEAVIEKVRALDVDLLEWAIDEMGHTVYEETDTEPAECTDECPACAVEEVARGLRALLDGGSEGRES